jgi:signal transduction histidine kinase
MPRPPDPAELSERSSTRLRRLTLAAALAASLLAVALGLLALARPAQAAPSLLQAWALALGMACVAAAVGWTLWRQHALTADLHRVRTEALALRDLCDAWIWEADTTHRVTRWRPPADAALRGPQQDAVVGRPLWEVFDAEAVSAATLRSRMEGGLPLRAQAVALPAAERGAAGSHRFELRGTPLPDPTGATAGWIGSARALDDAEALDHDRSTLQALLLALPVPVFEFGGDASGARTVRRANPAAAQWLGSRADELEEMDFAELLSRLPQDLRPVVAQALAQPRDGAELPPCAGWQVHVRSLAARAGAGPASTHCGVLVLMPPGRVEAGAPSPAAAADSESFSYTVSHDLRAPVRVVEGFTKILKEDYGRQLDRIGNDHLDRVLGAAARMNSMIDALLALSQLSSRPLSRQPVNLSQLAAYVVEDLRRQAPERKVGVHVEGGLLAQGDPTLLRVVLENLIGNAWKYSSRTRNAQIWLERGQHAGQAVFTVRDNGAGFDMRFADRLFGVFQRLHSASDFPGTGIGLATVRRIVTRHGGEIWAESVVDRGSSFHFTIPPAPATGG